MRNISITDAFPPFLLRPATAWTITFLKENPFLLLKVYFLIDISIVTYKNKRKGVIDICILQIREIYDSVNE